MGTMFGSVEDYGEMFQDTVATQTRGASPCSTKQSGNPAVYRLVRVCSQKYVAQSYGNRKDDVFAIPGVENSG